MTSAKGYATSIDVLCTVGQGGSRSASGTSASLTFGAGCGCGGSGAARRSRTTSAGGSSEETRSAKKLSGTNPRWLATPDSCHWRRAPSPPRATWPVPKPPSGNATARRASPE
ncbi:hypothetical protein GCM10027610_043230 [Dactylosporangium cerinum]